MKKIFNFTILFFVSIFLFIGNANAETGEVKLISNTKFRYKYRFGHESYSVYCRNQILNGTDHRVYNFNIPYNKEEPLYNVYNEDVISFIPKASFEKIRKIVYYGDMLFNNSQDELYYFVTNGLIIKALEPDEFIYYERDNYTNTIYEKTEELLEREIENYFIKPSFDNEQVEVNLNDSLTIIDKNNILSDYQLIEVLGDSVSYEIVDNKISLKALKPGVTTFKMKKEYNDRDYDMEFLYEEGKNAFAITPGNFTLYSSFSISVNANRIALEIKDDDTLFSDEGLNVSYGIYNQKNELVYQVNTNVEGIFYTDYLPYGNYYVKEISNSTIYEKNNSIYKVNLSEEESKVVILNHKKNINEFDNILKFRTITISFFDEEGRLINDDIYFSVMDENYQSNGKKLITLKDGDYLFKIIKIPDEYVLKNDTKVINVNDNMDIKFVLNRKEEGIGSEEIVAIDVPNTLSFNYFFIFIGLRYVKKFSKW